MRVSSRGYTAAAVGVALALVAAGCTSDNGGDTTGGKTGGEITVAGSEPSTPLIPGMSAESGGIRVLHQLFTGLVRFDPVTAEKKNAMAESIETPDAKVYTIKIKKGWKFHDGTEVKAKNFVDSWTWTAFGPNGAQNSSFFGDIQGAADLTSEDPDGEGPLAAPAPKAKEFAGLKVVDDYTFTATLSAPNSTFPIKIGYAAFAPLPDAFFKDSKAFGEKPIGNGAMKFVSWTHDDAIVLEKNKEYPGDDPVHVDKVTFKSYTKTEAAYTDVIANRLDGLEQVPTNVLIGDKWKNELGEGRWTDRDSNGEVFIAFPMYDKRFANPKLRQAISMSIDRALITDKIFFKSRKPADAFVPPVMPGYKSGTCKYCEFNPEKAKALFAEAGGWKGELAIYYNADASHKDWTEATANSISKTLGITAVAKPIPTFKALRQQIDAHKMDGIYRAAWGADYPHKENFLNPLYKTKASSNDGLFSDPAVDAKLAEADGKSNLDEALKAYDEAEALVAEAMPVIPMWFPKAQAAFSDRITGGRDDAFGDLDIKNIRVK